MAHRRGGFAKKIDSVHWELIAGAAINQATATISAQLALAAQHLPETLLRIRGEWAAAFTTALASGIGVNVTAGLILVPEGTGSTALWSPFTDGDAPWIWWDTMSLIYTEQVTDVVYSAAVSSGRRVIDSKAMRKVRNSELQCVVETATIVGLSGANINMSMVARVLAGS